MICPEGHGKMKLVTMPREKEKVYFCGTCGVTRKYYVGKVTKKALTDDEVGKYK